MLASFILFSFPVSTPTHSVCLSVQFCYRCKFSKEKLSFSPLRPRRTTPKNFWSMFNPPVSYPSRANHFQLYTIQCLFEEFNSKKPLESNIKFYLGQVDLRIVDLNLFTASEKESFKKKVSLLGEKLSRFRGKNLVLDFKIEAFNAQADLFSRQFSGEIARVVCPLELDKRRALLFSALFAFFNKLDEKKGFVRFFSFIPLFSSWTSRENNDYVKALAKMIDPDKVVPFGVKIGLDPNEFFGLQDLVIKLRAMDPNKFDAFRLTDSQIASIELFVAKAKLLAKKIDITVDVSRMDYFNYVDLNNVIFLNKLEIQTIEQTVRSFLKSKPGKSFDLYNRIFDNAYQPTAGKGTEAVADTLSSTAGKGTELTVDKAQSAAENAEIAAKKAQAAAEELRVIAEKLRAATEKFRVEKAQSAADKTHADADKVWAAIEKDFVDKAQSVADKAQSAAENAEIAAKKAQATADKARAAVQEAQAGNADSADQFVQIAKEFSEQFGTNLSKLPQPELLKKFKIFENAGIEKVNAALKQINDGQAPDSFGVHSLGFKKYVVFDENYNFRFLDYLPADSNIYFTLEDFYSYAHTFKRAVDIGALTDISSHAHTPVLVAAVAAKVTSKVSIGVMSSLSHRGDYKIGFFLSFSF